MTQEDVDWSRVQRTADVAHDYDALTGLTAVALGCGFVAAELSGWVIFLALGGWLSVGCAWWYRRRFGAVRPQRARIVRRAICGWLALVALIAAAVVDAVVSPPFSLSLLVAAVLFSVVKKLGSLPRVGLTPVHWVVCAALAAAAFAPLAGIGSTAFLSAYVLTAIGAAMIVMGLVDHARLVRAMAPLPAEHAVQS